MSLTLTDDTPTTPVNRVFVGVSSDPSETVWKDVTTNSGYPVGAGTAKMSVKDNPNGSVKVTLILNTRELVKDGSDIVLPPELYSENFSKHEFVLSPRSSLQNRKDHYAMAKDFLSDSKVQDAIQSYIRPTA
jgi:hypothetical protein